jgi:Tfp pilus assembly protein PilF
MAKKKRTKGRRKNNRKKQTRPVRKGRSVLIALAIIVGVVFVAYSPVLNAGFVDIDDYKLILDKGRTFLNRPMSYITSGFGSPHYKPVTYATWIAEYHIARDTPFLYHFDNLLLHLFNCILVFFITRQLSRRFKEIEGSALQIAFFSSLLFGLHPLHMESVSWVIERKDVLFTFFYLLGVAGYIRYLGSKSYLILGLSVVAYFLSMLSKLPGVTMPGVLFLIDYVWKRKLDKRLFLEKAGYFAVFIFALFAFGVVTRSSGEGSIGALMNPDKVLSTADNMRDVRGVYGKTVLASMRGWLWYVHSWIPVRTAIGYPREQIIGMFGPLIHALLPLLVAAGFLILRFRKKYPLLFFGHVFFFMTLLPAIMRLGLGIGIFMSDRYVYLPVFGLIFLFVSWLFTIRERKWFTERVRMVILGGLALVFAITTFLGTQVWKSPETLWTNVIEKYPSVDYAFVNRGGYYREQGDYQRALTDLNKAIERKEDVNSFIQRGLIYRQMGQPANAIPDYNRALELEPDNTQARANRGNAYLDMRQMQQAIADYNVVLEAEPRNFRTRVNRAIAYASQRQFEQARADFLLAEEHNPYYDQVHLNLAVFYFETGDYDKALKYYQQFLGFHPDDHATYHDMAIVYMRKGDHNAALENVNIALRMQVRKLYYQTRANIYDAMGNAQAAQQDRQTASQL